MCWVQDDGPLISRDGLSVAAELVIENPQSIVRCSTVGIEFDRLTVGGGRLFGLSQFAVNVAQAIVGSGFFTVECNCLLIGCPRVFILCQFKKRMAQSRMGRRIAGSKFNCFVKSDKCLF